MRSLPGIDSAIWIYALLGLLGAIHVSMILGRSINGDEFWFYSQVEIVARGEAIQPLQTIHTRAFAWWLPRLPGNEIDHIRIARLFMLGCLAVTGFGIYAIARAFADHRAALIAAAAYLGAGYVLQHGTSFRVDPIVAAFLTNALAVAIRTNLSARWIVVLGILVGFAAMVTIKFILWAPAFAGAALWRWQARKFEWHYLARWIAAGAVALAVFALLFTLHSIHQGMLSAEDSATGTLTSSGERMFGLNDFIYIEFMGAAAAKSLPLAAMALMVPFVLISQDLPAVRKWSVAGLWIVALTPIYYQNSSPYAYVFFLPPIAATTAFAAPYLAKRYSYAALAGAIAISALTAWAVDRRDVLPQQQQLLGAIHTSFPEASHYFDCCGMLGSLKKANGFRSPFGIENYLAAGRPEFRDAMLAQTLPLAINNNDDFSTLFAGDASQFLAEDAAVLRENFIPFWGDIYIAGIELAPETRRNWSLLVPGIYTARGEMIVNGKKIADGSLIELQRGTLDLENTGPEPSRLVWGKRPQAPQYAPPEEFWVSF